MNSPENSFRKVAFCTICLKVRGIKFLCSHTQSVCQQKYRKTYTKTHDIKQSHTPVSLWGWEQNNKQNRKPQSKNVIVYWQRTEPLAVSVLCS